MKTLKDIEVKIAKDHPDFTYNQVVGSALQVASIRTSIPVDLATVDKDKVLADLKLIDIPPGAVRRRNIQNDDGTMNYFGSDGSVKLNIPSSNKSDE